MAKLGDCISAAKVQRCGEQEYPILSITMKDGIVLQSEKFKKRIASAETSKYLCVPKGKLVQGIHIDEGNFGVQSIVPVGIVSPAYKIWDINEDIVIPKYIEMVLRSPRCIEYYRSKLTGTVNRRGRMSTKDFLEMEIPLPNKEKQLKIVDLMNHVNQLLEMRQTEIGLIDQMVKSRFIELFGDINTNDKSWDCQPLGELCTIVRGGSPRPIEDYLGGDVPWIKIGDATKGDNVYLHSTKEHIIRAGVKKSRLVKNGSLIFANCGVSLGFARIITFDGCIHDGWLAMEDIDTRLDKVFLLQALNQMTDHFRRIAPAGTQPNLNTAIMKEYIQIIPPMELQKEYIAFVEQTDKSKYYSFICYQNCLQAVKIYRQEWMSCLTLHS